MIEEISGIDPPTLAQFDAIIDARSPAEFAEDRLPGAINLPVLNNRERAEVGTIYKQTSRFDARRIGAAYVAKNVAAHLETTLADKSRDFRPLIYCWRGGMRSNAMATILAHVGWRTGVLQGGYKTWRCAVVAALRESIAPLPLILIDGQTGTAKTDILHALASQGAQIIDLEHLAQHRGSVFGAHAKTPQPGQKLFETGLYEGLQKLNLSAPIFVEAESNRIGRCELPGRLWAAMRAAPRIAITADRDQRAAHLIDAYADMAADQNALSDAVNRLRPFHAASDIEHWLELVSVQDFVALAHALMRAHYDPLYDRSRQSGKPPLAKVQLARVNQASIRDAAAQITAIGANYVNAAIRDCHVAPPRAQ